MRPQPASGKPVSSVDLWADPISNRAAIGSASARQRFGRYYCRRDLRRRRRPHVSLVASVVPHSRDLSVPAGTLCRADILSPRAPSRGDRNSTLRAGRPDRLGLFAKVRSLDFSSVADLLRHHQRLVSRVSPVQTAMRNCTRDEGRSFGFGNQVLISSHRKLLWSKAMVVSVAEKSGHDPVRHG